MTLVSKQPYKVLLPVILTGESSFSLNRKLNHKTGAPWMGGTAPIDPGTAWPNGLLRHKPGYLRLLPHPVRRPGSSQIDSKFSGVGSIGSLCDTLVLGCHRVLSRSRRSRQAARQLGRHRHSSPRHDMVSPPPLPVRVAAMWQTLSNKYYI
jgi:hypothetical protein